MVTTKQPLRGFSLFNSTVYPFDINSFSIFSALVLNAFHDLQNSINAFLTPIISFLEVFLTLVTTSLAISTTVSDFLFDFIIFEVFL
jgi:hypothetical protein